MKRFLAAGIGALLLMSNAARSQDAAVAAPAEAPVAAAEAAPAWTTDALGELGIFPMESAPFPHESRAEGFTYNDKVFPADPHYIDNSVALFLPRGYKAGPTVDLLFYWHGWSNNIRKAMPEFKLREQVVAAGKNVILVFPEGPKDATDSGCGRLEEPGALAALAAEVMERLRADGKVPADATLGRVILSGHSGAYRVMTQCAKQGGLDDHLCDIFLLDASYALLDQIADWLVRRPDGRLRSIYTEHLRVRNEELMKTLDDRGIAYLKTTDTDVTDEQLSRERVVFMATTTRVHNQAPELLEPWLRTSRLENIPPAQ